MDPASVNARRARPLLGTFVEIDGTGVDRSIVNTAIDAAFDAVVRVHALMSFHEAGSDVGRLNQYGSTRPLKVDPWTYRVIEQALDLHRRSEGTFDITVAPVLQELGLLPPSRQPRPQSRMAMAQTVELLPDCRIRFQHPGVRIDLGGIAKGFAVDRAVDALRSFGLQCGLVNAGGDLAAFGLGCEPVYIRNPLDPSQFIDRVEVADAALATSGPGHAPTRLAQLSGSAIIDPRSRRPIVDIVGATIRAPSCMMADALTKVVIIAGTSASALLDHYQASALVVLPGGDIQATQNWKGAAPLAA
jgi:thiamine biosynthesis lipoprotein